jgi:uncharacterized protein (TIGR02588 family)
VSAAKRQDRTAAEWVTFAVSVLVLFVVAGAIVVEARQHHSDAQPVAVVGATRRIGRQYQVEVTLENRGDKAASAVQVVASLEVDGETTESDQTVDFLAGGDSEDLVFVFADDPDTGKLDVAVGSFTVP